MEVFRLIFCRVVVVVWFGKRFRSRVEYFNKSQHVHTQTDRQARAGPHTRTEERTRSQQNEENCWIHSTRRLGKAFVKQQQLAIVDIANLWQQRFFPLTRLIPAPSFPPPTQVLSLTLLWTIEILYKHTDDGFIMKKGKL